MHIFVFSKNVPLPVWFNVGFVSACFNGAAIAGCFSAVLFMVVKRFLLINTTTSVTREEIYKKGIYYNLDSHKIKNAYI